MAVCNMNTTIATRMLAALLLLLLLPAAMPVSLASAARSNTPTPPPPAPSALATGVELREVSSVTGVLVKKVAASFKAPGAAMTGGSRPPLPESLASRRTLAGIKLIPPSGPSDGSNSYSSQPPPA
ncbi:unnamed protein product [Urochloa humidicola]